MLFQRKAEEAVKQIVKYEDIPLHRGGADGVETRKSDKPLVVAWKERNGAVERVTRVRPLDFYDVHGGMPPEFDEILDLEDGRERMTRREVVWFVSRDSEKFKQAEKELYIILHIYESAHNFSLKRYERAKERLLEAGYTLADIEVVPVPPAPIALLHMTNECKGEVHKGLFKGQQGHYSGKDYKRLFCTECGWISGNEPPTPPYRVRGPVSEMSNLIEDLGAEMIVPDPDYICNTYMPDFDLEPGDSDSELKKEEKIGLQITRRCLKMHGILISISEAARTTLHTTQNISNYIAKNRLRAWQDPDDSRYRLVMREEIENL